MRSHSSKTLILSSCMVMGVSLMIYFHNRIKNTKEKTNQKTRRNAIRKRLENLERKQSSGNVNKKMDASHVDRELLKEQRRKRMIPFMAMKKPMYDNILMKCPRGEVLSTISLKKANWYIRKNLAEWESSSDGKSIRLLFEPNTKRAIPTEQRRLVTCNQSIKKNCCVACGCEQDYRRHYIVPYAYRARFPPEFKTHMPHDVVILCPHCHVQAQTAAQNRMHTLEDELRNKLITKDVDSRHATFLDPTVQATRSAASALLKRKAQLPPEKVIEYDQIVRAFYNISDNDATQSVTKELLQVASRLEPRCPNPNFVSGPDLVEQLLLRDGTERTMEDAIMDFVQEWRILFHQTLQPRFLPLGWAVDSPVRCESRSNDPYT